MKIANVALATSVIALNATATPSGKLVGAVIITPPSGSEPKSPSLRSQSQPIQPDAITLVASNSAHPPNTHKQSDEKISRFIQDALVNSTDSSKAENNTDHDDDHEFPLHNTTDSNGIIRCPPPTSKPPHPKYHKGFRHANISDPLKAGVMVIAGAVGFCTLLGLGIAIKDGLEKMKLAHQKNQLEHPPQWTNLPKVPTDAPPHGDQCPICLSQMNEIDEKVRVRFQGSQFNKHVYDYSCLIDYMRHANKNGRAILEPTNREPFALKDIHKDENPVIQINDEDNTKDPEIGLEMIDLKSSKTQNSKPVGSHTISI